MQLIVSILVPYPPGLSPHPPHPGPPDGKPGYGLKTTELNGRTFLLPEEGGPSNYINISHCILTRFKSRQKNKLSHKCFSLYWGLFFFFFFVFLSWKASSLLFFFIKTCTENASINVMICSCGTHC